MVAESPGPFARPLEGVRIKEGAPRPSLPSAEEIAGFPLEAKGLLDKTWEAQKPLIDSGQYTLDWMEGRHFLLVGATGPGLGGAIATAVQHLLGDSGSLTVIARDLSKSVGYETGKEMQRRALEAGLEERFHWINDGLALEGKGLENILTVLKEAGADRVVYINTVAAANSGILPGYPPVYVKDVDEGGIFLWKLTELTEKQIEATKHIMGTMAVKFPYVLEDAGIRVDATAFADWRGSLDRESRNPASPTYGRWGAYSTSLYLPKDIIQEEAKKAEGSERVVIDVFFPMMKTRALPFIPGGVAVYNLYGRLMEEADLERIEIPELALGMLDKVGKATIERGLNNFPRLDKHELGFDSAAFDIITQINNDPGSEYYFGKWLV